MRPIRNLPGPRFRVISLATLAAITVGGTALGVAPTTNGSDDAATPSLSAPTDDADETVTEVTTTLPATPDPAAPTTTIPDIAAIESTDDVAAVVATGSDTEVLDRVDVSGAPVSGAPVVAATVVDTCTPDTSMPDAAMPEDRSTDTMTTEAMSTEAMSTDAMTTEAMSEETTAAEPSLPTSESTEARAPDASGPVDVDVRSAEPSSAVSMSPSGSDDPSSAFVEDFENGDVAWIPLSGAWEATDGRYVQSDATGYDFISQLDVEVPEYYALSVQLQTTGDSLGGGVLVGQPVAGSRRGATLIDFTDGGDFLRWGVYDADSGQYRYTGGVDVGDDFDPTAAHTLRVEVRSGRTSVSVDGRSLGEFAGVPAGRIGLATSLSAVAFDDVQIEGL